MTGERRESAALWPGELGLALPISSDTPRPAGTDRGPCALPVSTFNTSRGPKWFLTLTS